MVSWWVWVLVGVFFCTAAAAVVWAIVKKGGGVDRGFMVREGVELWWARKAFPLMVFYEEGLPQAALDAWRKVRTEINKTVGAEMFDLGTDMERGFDFTRLPYGCVGIVFDKESETEAFTTDLKFKKDDGEVGSALIVVRPGAVFMEWLFTALLHEGYHVLGLAHDEQRGSLLYGRLHSRDQSLTDNDEKRLRERYGDHA